MTRWTWLGFVLLCLIAGSTWLFDEALPGLLTGLPRTAAHDGLLALIFGIVGARRHYKATVGVAFWMRLALASVAMFGLPGILFAAAGGRVSELTELLIFLLVPLAVIFVVAQRSAAFGAAESPMRWMAPALAGLAGAALLLPFDWPPSTAGRFWLVAMVASALLAGAAAVRIHGLLQGVELFQATAVVCAMLSVVAACFSFVGWTGMPSSTQPLSWAGSNTEVLRCVVLDGPIILLTVWLLRRMAPIPFSARILLIPLLTIVESFVLLRPALTWTIAGGVLLLAAGALGLLRADSNKML